MAYVLSEELQRRKLLNQRYSIFSVNLFGSMEGLVNDPHFSHSTSEWDVSLQEMVAALHEVEDTVPPLDLDTTRIEHLGDGRRQSSPLSMQSIPESDKAYQTSHVVGDDGATGSYYDDRQFETWIKKAEDENKNTFDSGTVNAPKDMPAINSGRRSCSTATSPDLFSADAAVKQEKDKACLDSDSLIEELNLVFKHMTQAQQTEDTRLSSSRVSSSSISTAFSSPLANSTPYKAMYARTSRDALCDADWTAILYNEFRARLLDVSMKEIFKCEFDCSRIDKDLLDFVRSILNDHRDSSSSHTKIKEITNRGICYALIEMRMVGLDIKKHLTMWHNTWQAKIAFVKAFNECLNVMPHAELRNKLLNVSFQFNDSHRVLLNCVLMLYHWQTTRHFSLDDPDFNFKDIMHKKGEKDFARLRSMNLSQVSEHNSKDSESNCNFIYKLNSSNEDLAKRVSEASKKETFFDEFEWQAILFEELKVRVRNELSFLAAGRKSLYDEEDGLQVKNSPNFANVIHEVFPEIVLNDESLCYFAKIFSGLSKFTQFNFSRHLLQWHSVYKSQPNALKRYERESVSYAWLIGELNFLNYLPNHPLRIIIDCLLMLSIDNVDVVSKS